jgi:hypothetical protein
LKEVYIEKLKQEIEIEKEKHMKEYPNTMYDEGYYYRGFIDSLTWVLSRIDKIKSF